MREGSNIPLNVRILYTEDCANTPQTVQRVRDVAQNLRIPIEVNQELVTTQDQANELRFLGSPTVQVNGRDIEPEARAVARFGLT